MEKRADFTRLSQILTIVLAVIILGTIGYFSYVITVPQGQKPFTEFYILGSEGKAHNYPKQLKVGEEVSLTLGIINREQKTTSYQVEIKIAGATSNTLKPIVLEHDEKLEQLTSFTPETSGDNQTIDFLLYQEGQTTPCGTLRLWVDIEE